jgi:X-Pro dipeptidyl-peptidase
MIPYAEDGFDYDDLYEKGDVRIADEEDTMTAALKSDPSEWDYQTPSNSPGFYNVSLYDYFLIRGFAVVEACGIGTWGSEGFELCGMDLERDSHKCVIEWLTGDRAAFIDKEGTKSIKADWCNKNVAMTGCSYGGTLPFEVATTGVKGLKTIIPLAGIANWYDYTNSQGICTYGTYNYTDILAAFNSGSLYLDDNWKVMNDSYGSFLKKIADDQTAAKGLFAPVWQMLDYSDKYEDIDCSALIIHGLNDFNVSTLQSENMYNAFKAAGKEVKLILHQDAHNYIYGLNIGNKLFDEILNRWLCHYLYGEENGAEDIPELSVQSNVDGSFTFYDTFPDTESVELLSDDRNETKICSDGFEGFYNEYVDSYKVIDRYYLEQDEKHVKVFDLETDNEEALTFIGSCEVHVDLKTDDTGMDNMMVTAVLLDTDENGDTFKAFIAGNDSGSVLPRKTVGGYEIGGGHEDGNTYEFVRSSTDVKAIAYGWTNLSTPGRGKSASEYTEKSDIKEDTYYSYNIYLKPTVYTLRSGHKLKLALLAQDPQRVLMDEIDNDDTPYYIDDYEDPCYSFTVDEGSLAVKINVIK